MEGMADIIKSYTHILSTRKEIEAQVGKGILLRSQSQRVGRQTPESQVPSSTRIAHGLTQ